MVISIINVAPEPTTSSEVEVGFTAGRVHGRPGRPEAAEKYLVTRKRGMTKENVIATFNRQFLRLAGFSDEEIDGMGDLSQLTSEEMQNLIKKRSMQSLGLNGNSKQKVVAMGEVRNWIGQGWEFVTALPSGEAVIRLPASS
jgi:hypothetical protein